MLGEEFSMLDVAVAPLLWRLDHYGIELPKNAAPIQKYAERIFSRPAYIEALTPDRKSVVSGKSVSVRVDLGGRRIIKKKKQHLNNVIYSHTRVIVQEYKRAI